jgi:hypothetical protein
LEGVATEDVGIFYYHLVYFTAIWYVLWQFGIFCGNLVHFSSFWYAVPRKIWQLCKYVVGSNLAQLNNFHLSQKITIYVQASLNR